MIFLQRLQLFSVSPRLKWAGQSALWLSWRPPLQVNPLAETDTEVVAADAKLGFDDNAAFRQQELFAMRDESQEDPR